MSINMYRNISFGNNKVNLTAYKLSNSLLSHHKLLALHGFMGSSYDFQPLAHKIKEASWYALDLLGHGLSDSPQDLQSYSLKNTLDSIHTSITHLNIIPSVLVGYSMGGRIALHYALNFPQSIKGLVLIGSTPGISDESLRVQRMKEDEALANKIESMAMEDFVTHWFANPIIQSQNNIEASILKQMLARRHKNDPKGLANSLRALGTGQLSPLWNSLSQIKCPVLLIAGQNDLKFNEIAKKMTGLIPNATYQQISNVGHTAHLEDMESFSQILRDWLKVNT